ncbi:nuclear transport factor 2 family protein [Variovorax sp. DT-64]|uniref:nuclear transport factor 2 family protein n=1 Tax=Variovorax sp. DT-64 TaxID=3396160 RepID=UPI003F1E0B6D
MPRSERTPASLPVPPGAAETRADAAADPEIEDLVLRATQAHAALMRGDLDRYRSSITVTDDFTLMAPFGGKPTRAAELSSERWDSIARFFRNGRDSTLEVVQAYRSADMVVIAAIERTHVEVGGLPGQDWALRVTLVFRKEKDQWMLAHRHADPLVEGISLEQAAALSGRHSSS